MQAGDRASLAGAAARWIVFPVTQKASEQSKEKILQGELKLTSTCMLQDLNARTEQVDSHFRRTASIAMGLSTNCQFATSGTTCKSLYLCALSWRIHHRARSAGASHCDGMRKHLPPCFLPRQRVTCTHGDVYFESQPLI